MSQSVLLGVYDQEHTLIKGIHSLQEKGYKIIDVIMPYPVHEVFQALKVKSNMPRLAGLYGLVAFALTWYFLYWANTTSYPLNFGGKPLNATPSFVIIIFVLVINLTGFLSFMTLLSKRKMYPGKKIKLADLRALDDKFVILVEKTPDMDEEKLEDARSVLTSSGAIETNIKTI